MIQAVQNGKRFSPERDLINAFPVLVGGAAEALVRAAMPPAVRDFADHCGAAERDIAAACSAMAEFINITRSLAFVGDDLPAAYVRSGLDRVPQAAAVALYANIGMALTQAFFKFVREALPPEAKTPGIDAMTDMLSRTAHALSTDDPVARARRAADVHRSAGRHTEDLS